MITIGLHRTVRRLTVYEIALIEGRGKLPETLELISLTRNEPKGQGDTEPGMKSGERQK